MYVPIGWLHRPCGILLGDDWHPGVWDGVVRAVNEFVAKEKLTLHTSDVKWYVHKPCGSE